MASNEEWDGQFIAPGQKEKSKTPELQKYVGLTFDDWRALHRAINRNVLDGKYMKYKNNGYSRALVDLLTYRDTLNQREVEVLMNIVHRVKASPQPVSVIVKYTPSMFKTMYNSESYVKMYNRTIKSLTDKGLLIKLSVKHIYIMPPEYFCKLQKPSQIGELLKQIEAINSL